MKKLFFLLGLSVSVIACQKETPTPIQSEDGVHGVKSNGQGGRTRKFVEWMGFAGCVNTPKDCLADVILTPASAADIAFSDLEIAILSNEVRDIETLLTSSPINTFIGDEDVIPYMDEEYALSVAYSEDGKTKYFVFKRISDGVVMTVYPVTN